MRNLRISLNSYRNMEKQLWVLLLVGLCSTLSLAAAQNDNSMSFDDFDPVEEEYLDQREEQWSPDDYGTIMAERELQNEPEYEDEFDEDLSMREFQDEPEYEDQINEDLSMREFQDQPEYEEDIENDVSMREFGDDGPVEYDGQMEEDMEERAAKEKVDTEEESCSALAKGKKDSCETDVESYTGKEKTKDRLILNRKAQTITDLVKEGIRKQIVHFDYKRNVLAVAIQRRKMCMLYRLPTVSKKIRSRFYSAAKKMAAFAKSSGRYKGSSRWRKARCGRTRYGARFQSTGEAVNSTTLGTVISNKVCKGLNMKWVKVVRLFRNETANKDKERPAREIEDMDPSQGSDEEMLEERALKRTQSVCRVVFLRTSKRVTHRYKCGWLWKETCYKYQSVNVYTMRCR